MNQHSFFKVFFLLCCLTLCFPFFVSASLTTSLSTSRNGNVIPSGPGPVKISLPLNVSQNYLIDQLSQRVKLACTNWPSHMELMIPEGLAVSPLERIIQLINEMGYNCIRYTYSIDFADPYNQNHYYNLTLSDHLINNLNITNNNIIYQGLLLNNPNLFSMSLIQIFKYVLSKLQDNHLMVILDNHVSKAQWCCSMDDGNGWFNLGYFNVDNWIGGLTHVASFVKENELKNVIAMSLRNELRAPEDMNEEESIQTWFQYMPIAAQSIHNVNKNLLIISGGLEYATRLSFITDQENIQVKISDKEFAQTKILYEAHWYSWSGYGSNCSDSLSTINNRWSFIFNESNADKSYFAPLFLSEIGDNIDDWTLDLLEPLSSRPRMNSLKNYSSIDYYNSSDKYRYSKKKNLNSSNVPSDYYKCVKLFLTNNDISFSTWVLSGSYYIRDNIYNDHESFGLLNDYYNQTKSPLFDQWIQSLFHINNGINKYIF